MPSSFIRRTLLSDVEATPWKNGGGVTRQIATGVAPCPGLDWGWRFSIADVECDGPFSIFPETDRIIAVIEGDGMDLLHPDGTVTALEPFQPVRISGDDSLFGRLRGGPVQDLNIMTARGDFEATLDVWHGPRTATLETGGLDCLLIHNLSGSCAVRLGGGETHELVPAETLVHEGRGVFEILLAEGTHAAVIRVISRDQPSVPPGP